MISGPIKGDDKRPKDRLHLHIMPLSHANGTALYDDAHY